MGPRDHSVYGGAAPEPPSDERTSGQASNDSGELSEGPSGPGGAGPERTGYAPGYGDYPSGPVDYGQPGGYAGSGGYGGPGHAPGASPAPSPTPWGKILGIGCGVLLLLLLVLGGCSTVMLFMAATDSPTGVGPVQAPVD